MIWRPSLQFMLIVLIQCRAPEAYKYHSICFFGGPYLFCLYYFIIRICQNANRLEKMPIFSIVHKKQHYILCIITNGLLACRPLYPMASHIYSQKKPGLCSSQARSLYSNASYLERTTTTPRSITFARYVVPPVTESTSHGIPFTVTSTSVPLQEKTIFA